MVKKQTFADKSKKKDKGDFVNVKCVFAVQDENKGTWKFKDRVVKVADVKDAEKMTADQV